MSAILRTFLLLVPCGIIAGWFLALFVWFVVYLVQSMLWDAQKRFVQMRIAWLQHRGKCRRTERRSETVEKSRGWEFALEPNVPHVGISYSYML